MSGGGFIVVVLSKWMKANSLQGLFTALPVVGPARIVTI
jgi:hypothetical protein